MDKRRILFLVLFMVWLGWTLPAASSQTPPSPTQAPLPPGTEIHIQATPQSATVGDPIRIDLDIAMPAGYQVHIERLGREAGDFAVLSFQPGQAVPGTAKAQMGSQTSPKQSEEPIHYRAEILAAVYKIGKFTFPPIPIELKTPEGKTIATATPPVIIEIRTVLTGKDRELKNLKKQAEMPEPFRWGLWLGIALACAAAAAAAWLLWRRHRKRPDALSPEQTRDLLDLAETDLRNLLARGLPDCGMEKQFYVLLSEIVKRILDPGYEIHTAERTTSEIMEFLRGKPAMAAGKAELIESFLLRCDIVKFAKYIPSKAEQEAAARDALQVLSDAKQAVAGRQPLPVAEQSAPGNS